MPNDGEPPIGRLRKRREFLAVAAGRRFHTERMTVQGLLREGDANGPLRIGFTVTKRVGHATERNRIKRRLRRVALQMAVGHQAPQADIVVIARRPVLSADYTLLIADLERALQVVARPRSARPAPKRSPPSSGDDRRGPPHA